MFSNLSLSSISLATVTPSFVMRGAPNDLSRTTLRPLGPSVTLTALARISTPFIIFWRASEPNFTSLAAMVKTFHVFLHYNFCIKWDRQGCAFDYRNAIIARQIMP